MKSAEIETAYAGFRDIVVLDSTPDDIAVVAGIISQEFQTPLSHINVLARNRGTPNMGLRNAFNDPALRALDGKWVHLVVGAFEYTLTEVSAAEADAWWEAHKPQPRQVPPMDLTATDLRDIGYVVDETLGPIDAAGDPERPHGVRRASAPATRSSATRRACRPARRSGFRSSTTTSS